MANAHILIAEDEAPIVEVLSAYLQRDGLTSHHIRNGDEVIPWLSCHHADLLLLDIMLPKLDGFEICKKLRRNSQIPIIMISARVEEIDRLIGLEIGADDYICKPFSPREVLARVKTVLRRAQVVLATPTSGGDIEVDISTFTARVLGRPLDLTPTEFKLLAALFSRRGHVFSRAQLLDAVSSKDEVFDRSIDSHIKNLRRKISLIVRDQEVIQSIYGMGYRMEIGSLLPGR